ncbi:hypothetical protein ACVIJ6_002438 [Bradyrhizobium sp. USDA 4369]
MTRKVQSKTPHLNRCGAILSTAVLKYWTRRLSDFLAKTTQGCSK